MITNRKDSAVPKSNASTAYGLLSDICTLITDEPKRMRMGDWHTSLVDLTDEAKPKCGTVGCIGGWIETLRPRRAALRFGVDTLEYAGKVLGFDATYAGDDPDSEAIMDLFLNQKLTNAKPQGTPKHAAAVVRHIRKFQQKHARRLRAHKIRKQR